MQRFRRKARGTLRSNGINNTSDNDNDSDSRGLEISSTLRMPALLGKESGSGIFQASEFSLGWGLGTVGA